MEKKVDVAALNKFDQSQIVIDETEKSSILLGFNSSFSRINSGFNAIGKISINLLYFSKYKDDLEATKKALKNTMWTLEKEEEQQLEANYNRIIKAKDLNVDVLSTVEALKSDYKSAPVTLLLLGLISFSLQTSIR